MLATKISFMNELSNIAYKVGADIEKVRLGIGSDPRIGYAFIYAGAGYGGSCFPKDVRALYHTAQAYGYEAEILRSVEAVNERQKRKLLEKIKGYFGDDLTGRQFGIWGLSFKPRTDDMREAPSIVIINGLLEAGASLRAYDPQAMKEAQRIFGDKIIIASDEYEATKNADALIIITEWNEFREPDFDLIRKTMKTPLIFDGRNIYDAKKMAAQGFGYFSLGRKDVNISEPTE